MNNLFSNSYMRTIGGGSLRHSMEIPQVNIYRYDVGVVLPFDDMEFYNQYPNRLYGGPRRIMNPQFDPRTRPLGAGFLHRPRYVDRMANYYSHEEEFIIKRKLEVLCGAMDIRLQDELGTSIYKSTDSGRCLYCYNVTKKYCQICEGWYCSLECQKSDWPHHKTVCVPKPTSRPTVHKTAQEKKSSLRIVELNENKPRENNYKHKTHDSGRLNSIGTGRLSSNGGPSDEINTFVRDKSNFNRSQENFSRDRSNSNRSQENLSRDKPNSYRSQENFSRDKSNSYRSQENFSRDKSNSYRSQENFSRDKSNSYRSQENFSRDSPNSNRCQDNFSRDKSNWNRNQQNFSQDNSNLNRGQQNFSRDKSNLNRNHENFSRDNSNWNRSQQNFSRDKSDSNRSQQSTQDKSRSVNDRLNNKRHDIANDSKAESTPIAFDMKPESIFPKDKFTDVTVSVPVGPRQCWVQKVENKEKLLEVMTALVDTSNFPSPTNIEIGGVYTAPYEGLWYRVKVTQVKPVLKILYIDYGNEESCKQDDLRTLPESLKSIGGLAVKIHMAEPVARKYEAMTEDQPLSIKFISMSGDTAVVHVQGEEYSSKDIPQSPSMLGSTSELNMKQQGVSCELKGDENKLPEDKFTQVIVTVPIGPRRCWVQRFDSLSQLEEITKKLVDASLSLPPGMINHGDVYTAPYADVWYRVKVTSVVPDLKVLFIDFGNEEVCKHEELRTIPASLKEIPALALKIKLEEEVPSKYETLEENQTLNVKRVSMLDDVTIVKIKGEEYSEVSSTNVDSYVPLRKPKENIEIIPKKDEPLDIAAGTPEETTTEELSLEKTFTEKDIIYRDLPVDKTVDFLVLHKVDCVTFMGCEPIAEVISFVHGTMSADMKKHCESTLEKTYVPKNGELCFAKYEGDWYRALCTEAEENILFLDYGNTAKIDPSDIRKMTEVFAKVPALAVLCQVNGISSDTVTDDIKAFLDPLVQVNEIYKAYIVSKDDLGFFSADFPHLTE